MENFRTMLIEFASHIGYRLACTATPAPNDLIEIINHVLDFVKDYSVMVLSLLVLFKDVVMFQNV